MNMEYLNLVGCCLLCRKTLFLSKRTPSSRLKRQCPWDVRVPDSVANGIFQSVTYINWINKRPHMLWKTDEGKHCSPFQCQFSHMLLLVFVSSVGCTKPKKVKTKTPNTSEEAPKPTTISSLQCTLHMPDCPFAAIISQFEYNVKDEHPSLWIYPQELRNVAPLKHIWAHPAGFGCWNAIPLSDPLWSLMDYRAEISYSLHMKESHIEQHPAAKDCYFTWQFHNYSICYLTNMYI